MGWPQCKREMPLCPSPGSRWSLACICEEQGSIEEHDRDQVWGTGGEGLAPSWSCADPQNSQRDVEIGNYDDKNVGEDGETPETQEDLLIDLGVCTRHLHQWWHITEIVINNIFATETQAKRVGSVCYSIQEPSYVGASNKSSTERRGHRAWIKERVTDCHVAVIGHGC